MQDQPMVGPPPPRLWHDAHEIGFNPLRRLSRRQLQAMRDPKDVGVDGDRLFDTELIENDTGGLAADTGQSFKGRPLQRRLAAMAIDEKA
jgi:hypothetical protein